MSNIINHRNESHRKDLNCQICLNPTEEVTGYIYCRVCRHTVNLASLQSEHDYSEKTGRNQDIDIYLARKCDERMETLRGHITPHFKVLEVGCAEGELGWRIKHLSNIEYWGVEPSKDALIASEILDYVYPKIDQIPSSEHKSFDLLISFHVLEHIADVIGELFHWKQLIKEEGTIILDVPNGSGHKLTSMDFNPEHTHYFTPSSLALLCSRAGFDVESLTTGHYASPAYSDNLRVILKISKSNAKKEELLVNNIRNVIVGKFFVYGIGGDFRSYVEPFLKNLQIKGFLDGDPEKYGYTSEFIRVLPYSNVTHSCFPILISSIRFQNEIASYLISMGHSKELIFTLESILSV